MTARPHGPGVPQPAPSKLLLVGARRQLRRLAACLEGTACRQGRVIGLVDPTGRGRQLVLHPCSQPVPILGRLDQLSELVSRSGATDLLIALSERPATRLRPELKGLSGGRVRVHWVAPDARPRPDRLRRPPAWEHDTPPWSLRLSRLAKRATDCIAAALGLLVLSPLFLVVAVAILVSSGRPVFYTQERVGHRGRLFRIWKFRSMRIDAEAQTGPIWATDHDTRCTRIGEWLRHTNIDELPQLINVLKGDMSLVGPRPERPVFVEQFRGELSHYDDRHAVPVGMTGWAQVHGWRGRTSLRKRLQFDLDYIRHWSLGLDLAILAMTLQHVLFHKVRWEGGIGWLRRRRRG